MFKKMFGKSIGELFYNKKFLIVFSLICAIIFWLVIDISQNPVKTVTIDDVPVTIATADTAVAEMGLDVVGGDINQKVMVEVSGPNYIVSSVSKDDILVTVSLAKVKAAGTYELELIGTKNSSKIGFEITSVNPSVITLTFDKVETKSFDVEAKALGVSTPEDTALVAETAIVSDSANKTIQITGSFNKVESIKKVAAVAEVNRVLDATESFDAKIILYDENNNEIPQNDLTLDFASVNITVPIYKTKTVPLEAVFLNTPQYYVNNGVPYTMSVQDSKITEIEIKGPIETVDGMTSAKLAPLNFMNISPEKSEFECSLDLPGTVKTTDNTTVITVTLNLSNITTKTITVSDISADNLEAGYTVSGNAIKNVVICGSKNDIKNIDASDITAVVDLKNVGTGQATLQPSFTVNGYDTVWVYGEYNATVNIKAN